MIKKPKVSFICSVKNGSEYIKRCSSSVLNQSLNEIELIFVDDHSTDDTWSMMEEISRKDERARSVRNYGREGLTYSLNMGLDFARGDFVARIDVDDFAHRDRAEKQVAMLESYDKAVMVSSCYRVVDSQDWLLYSHGPPGDPKMLRWSLCFRNYVRHSTAMWRRSLDVRYEPAFPHAQDYELWCRIARVGDIVTLGSVVATIRERSDSVTNTKHAEQELAADKIAAEQWRFYTGSTMNHHEARCLRMIQHMKSSEQFNVFNEMGQEDFEQAVFNYCLLADGFMDKERPELDAFMIEVGNDIRPLLADGSKKEQSLAALGRARSSLGNTSIQEHIEMNFVKNSL